MTSARTVVIWPILSPKWSSSSSCNWPMAKWPTQGLARSTTPLEGAWARGFITQPTRVLFAALMISPNEQLFLETTSYSFNSTVWCSCMIIWKKCRPRNGDIHPKFRKPLNMEESKGYTSLSLLYVDHTIDMYWRSGATSPAHQHFCHSFQLTFLQSKLIQSKQWTLHRLKHSGSTSL